MNIIKSSNVIGQIFNEGRRVSTPDINLIIQTNTSQRDLSGRVAFIAGKKQGNAVWRNKAKRRMRALYRDLTYPLDSIDVLFVAKRSINQSDYGTMLKNLEQALRKAGIV